MSFLLWILAVVLVAAGLLGIVLPALPGHVLIFAGLALAAWADGFARVGFWTLAVIGAIALASYTIDFAAAAMGVRRLGATPRAMTGAAVGTLLGLFFGLPGIVIGPFLGAVVGELTATRDFARAGKAGMAAWIGFVVGVAIKVSLAFLMVAIFVTALAF
jgi:hypothetical protein